METENITTAPWPLIEEMGYTPVTPFWEEFSKADLSDNAVEEVAKTFGKAFEEHKGNYIWMTELTLVLNHKIWQHHKTNRPLARVYNTLWQKHDQWCWDTFTEEQKDYYYHTTD